MRPVLSLVGCLLLPICVVNAYANLGDPPASDPVKFVYSWQPGMTTYYRMITTTESKNSKEGAKGADVRSDRTAMLMRMETYSVRDDGSARIATSVVRLRREQIDEKGSKEIFDSANSKAASGDPMMKMFGTLVGTSTIMEMTTDGRVLHTQDLESLTGSMLKAALDGNENLVKKVLKEGDTSRFSKELLGGAVGQSMPKSPFISTTLRRVGEQWPLGTGKVKLLGNEISNEGTCTFESIDTVNGRRVAKVSSRGTTSMEHSSKSKDDSEPSHNFPPTTSTGTSAGVMLFDLDRGRLVRHETRILSTMKMPEYTIANHTMPGHETTMIMTMMLELVGPEDPIDPEAELTNGK